MRIKFKIVNGELTGYEAYKDDYEFFELDPDEIESNDESLITPYQPEYLKVVEGEVMMMDEAERAAVDAAKAATVIDIEKTKRELYHAFKSNINLFLAIYSPISDFLEYRNFTDLKEYVSIIASSGEISAEVLTAFNNVLLQNNINLDDY